MADINPNPQMQQPGQLEAPKDFKVLEPEIKPEEYVPKPLRKLHSFINHPNIARDLKAEELATLAFKVVREFEIDEQSCENWRMNVEKAMKIALQIIEKKNTPWIDCANVKYPLITIAAIQFASRAYAEIVKGNDVVKCRVKGEDKTGEKKAIGQRVADHMSWQLTEEMEDWEEDTDKLLHVLPVIGFVYRKTYFSPLLQRNVSEMVLPTKFVVHYNTKNLATCRRGTEILTYFKNDIREFVSAGLWLDPQIETLLPDSEHADDVDDPPHEFLEQHRWIDLDGDEYAEPYIVTVHRQSLKVVRIVARFDEDGIISDGEKVVKIIPDDYYTKIPFIPAPDGSFYDIGFGILLNAINESVNTIINQLLDAGTMANTGGGFVSNGVKLGGKAGGTISLKPNEWRTINAPSGPLKDAFFPAPIREPSATLFQLLGMLIEAGRDIAQNQDAVMGKQATPNTPAATTLSQVEQGMQVYGSIHKRIYRAFKMEFKKLFMLNVKYGKPKVEFHFNDEGQTVFQEDYKHKGFDIVPVADPKLSSDVQRIARAQAAMMVTGRPHVNEDFLTSLMVEAVCPEHKNSIMLPPEVWQKMPPPLPVRQIMLAEMQLKLDAQRIAAQNRKDEAAAILSLARAKDVGDSDSVEYFETVLNKIEAERDRMHEIQKQQKDQEAQMQQGRQGHQNAMEQQAAAQKAGPGK